MHPGGGIYFTDPWYQRPYWTRKKPDMEGRYVYYLAKGKTAAVAVVKNLKQPNGIIGTPDGRWLYVADIGAGKTFRYPVNSNGTLGTAELFTAMGSDGMTIDERGNVYLTGNGVTVFNPQGAQILHIPVPEKWTANLTFGGPLAGYKSGTIVPGKRSSVNYFTGAPGLAAGVLVNDDHEF